MFRLPQTFSFRYSRERHFSNFHEIDESAVSFDEEEDDEEEEDSLSDATDVDEQSNDEEEMERGSDASESSESSPFNDLIELSYQYHSEEREELKTKILEEIDNVNEEDEFTEEDAQREADSILMPKIKKTLRILFTNYIIRMTEKRNTSLMKAILKKAKEYVNDGFSDRAAIKAAVSYRKHMIYDLIDQES